MWSSMVSPRTLIGCWQHVEGHRLDFLAGVAPHTRETVQSVSHRGRPRRTPRADAPRGLDRSAGVFLQRAEVTAEQ
jgi:hypothetical protein